ncbi:MAG TPA: sodium:solute symporter family protein, partial [Vicinamibacteria bacterium]|nr:sodium:solute symporter family protein [Vicinamibacteria bacterium]
MPLAPIDWILIALYFALSLAIGLAYRKRAGSSLEEYFLSGRSLPWWMAGTSMVATTFAADTPLAVTGLVARNGIAGNWFWWAFALGGMITVFVYARLWRRAGVMTDVELVELRYGGKPAAFLRGFRSLYTALLVNSIILGWVTVAMLNILKFTVLSGTEAAEGAWDLPIIVALFAVVAIYSTLSGLWGVVVTDFIQFILAMGGCIVFAFFAVDHVGGMSALRERLTAGHAGGEQILSFLPDFSARDPWMPLDIFLIMIFVQWWASWYPSAEPGGGGSVVQRMASCRDERDAVLATLWFQLAHYCLRPWPWLLVALVALAIYPDLRSLPDPGVGYPMLIRDIAPPGLLGIMLVAFLAAYMSTISTQINWAASYLVGGLYLRFLKPDADETRLARVSRWASVLVTVFGVAASWLMRDLAVDEAWKLLAALGAGTGAVFMLRWFWWRVNAWSEISAMAASLVYFLIVSRFVASNERRLAVVALLTIVTWLLVTF